LDLPVGLQLYSVRTLLPNDYLGTLKQLAALGYREVEAAGFYNHSASEVKDAMQQAGMRCVSSHYGHDALSTQFEETLAFGKELGLEYIVCSSPGRKNPPTTKGAAMTMEDWRWNAEEFNKFGKKIKAAGMKFAYHNHVEEFHAIDGVVPYIELLEHTDPEYVSMEMDCGWVVVGGGNPLELLEKYPTRITMLHVKDFKSGASIESAKAAELGQGMLDYAPIFAAAAKYGHMKHCFVEQEEFLDVPAMQALKIDADYILALHG